MRHAIFAERLAPILATAEEALDIDPRDVLPERRDAVRRAQATARRAVPQLRALLYPEGD